MRGALAAVVAAVVVVMQAMGPAAATEPAIIPGLDPGGVAVAVLGAGIDYTKPQIAARLARDGEGQLIAWDFTDNDTRPFAADSPSTKHAEQLIARSGKLRLVIVKDAPGNPVAIARMISFATQTPARIIYCHGAVAGNRWPLFIATAQRFANHLFIIAHIGKRPPDLDRIENLISVGAGRNVDAVTNSYNIVARAAEILSETPDRPVKGLKRALADYR